VIRLALEGVISRVELDTAHFKGNYPDSCSMEAAVVEEVAGTVSADLTSTVIGQWRPLLARTPLQADRLHTFESELSPGVTATHVRLNIFPDGGVSRLRIFGDPTTQGRQRAVLQLFNQMDDGELREALADYCAAPTWIDRMAKGRPYASAATLLAAADSAADAVPPPEWLEAFRHHPRIGERTAERAQSTIAAGASATEQSGMAGATALESTDLADANRAYEDRFGHVFIISAAGKSPQDVLTSLRSRLGNDPATELDVAAAEQRRITRLRLERLLG
jgi:allantoicase